jgi:hypothetical protein
MVTEERAGVIVPQERLEAAAIVLLTAQSDLAIEEARK